MRADGTGVARAGAASGRRTDDGGLSRAGVANAATAGDRGDEHRDAQSGRRAHARSVAVARCTGTGSRGYTNISAPQNVHVTTPLPTTSRSPPQLGHTRVRSSATSFE